MNDIKRLIIIIIVAILPLMLGFSIVKGTFNTNNDPRFSVSVFYDYVLTFPSDSADSIRYAVGEIQNSGFNDAKRFNPDWSGDLFNDIGEIGRMIADFFTAIWDYILFSVKFCYLIVTLVIDGLVWILGFPSYLITS